jgi:nucleotide-binding universal stress UspA family protein
MYKHLVVHVDGGERSLERLDLALRLAKRWGARVSGLFAEGQTWGTSLARSTRTPRQPYSASIKVASARFQERVRKAGIDSEWWHVADREIEVAGVAARFCRYADLAILGQPDPSENRAPPDLAAQVLLESGRPVLIVPSVGHYPDAGRRVLVAWNGSRESSRALNDAIPMIREAEKVLVVDLKTPRAAGRKDERQQTSILRHLQSHGIEAERERTIVTDDASDKSGIDVLNTVLNRTSDFGADLVVMGARGKHGVPFPRAGRATRKSLESMIAPVLLSM